MKIALVAPLVSPIAPPFILIITHIFRDTFMSHGDKPSCIKETMYDLCFGNPFYRRLQKLATCEIARYCKLDEELSV